VALGGDALEDELAAERREPLAAEIEDEGAVPGRDGLHEPALVGGAPAEVRPKAVLPMVAEGDAQGEAGGEAAEGLVLPQHAGLGGDRAVEGEHLVVVALAAERIGAPEIHVLADQALWVHGAGVIGAGAQLSHGVRVGELAAHGVELGGVDQEAIGRLEGGSELRRLQVLGPALVVAVPLLEVRSEAPRMHQPEPQQPAGTRARPRRVDLDGERADGLRAGEIDPFLAPEGAGRLARAAARAGIGLGHDRDARLLGQVDADDEPLEVGAVEILVLPVHVHHESIGRRPLPLERMKRPAARLGQTDALRCGEGPFGELAQVRVEKRLKDRFRAVDGREVHGEGKDEPKRSRATVAMLQRTESFYV